MILRLWLVCLALLPLAACVHAQEAASGSNERLDRQFQAAVAQYESGRFAEAAAALEALLRDVPESFELHELLGLTYSALSQDGKAAPHLEKAVRLKPDYADAHNNLGATLFNSGRWQEAVGQFEAALRLRPDYPAARENLSKARQMLPSSEEKK